MPAEGPTFENDIKAMFREFDRLEMEYAFDLWKYEDVVEQADNILDRLEDGTMPCDDPWDEERVDVYRAWLEAGCPQ